MREVLFKDLTSINARKKDIFLREVFERGGVTARTQRRCFYLIKDVRQLEGEKDLQDWLDSNSGSQDGYKREFHIMKEHNDALGEDKVICKIAGTFYAVINNRIYTIGFLHSFKVSFTKSNLVK
ncbi:MAG: hypothetical protein WC738_04665 [Candidatus Omnitrophota bacterium]|jgi:hypothetical protein